MPKSNKAETKVCAPSKKIKRRKGYWKYYHQAHSRTLEFLVRVVVFLLDVEVPRLQERDRKRRGPKRKHSRQKMDCVCILMIILGLTTREIENLIPYLRLPWDEPTPDHTTISRHLGTVPLPWLHRLVAILARMCLDEIGWTDGIVAADSTGVETDTYRKLAKKDKNTHETVVKRIKKYLKWHVLSVLECKAILTCVTTPSNVGDSPTFRKMLDKVRDMGIHLKGSACCADKAYDSDKNCRMVFEMGMTPQIPQRDGATNADKPHRKKAAKLFDQGTYRYRGLIEGIFGATEVAGHRLHCRFRKIGNQRRFGLILAIGWNIDVLNRLQCATACNIRVKSYVKTK